MPLTSWEEKTQSVWSAWDVKILRNVNHLQCLYKCSASQDGIFIERLCSKAVFHFSRPRKQMSWRKRLSREIVIRKGGQRDEWCRMWSLFLCFSKKSSRSFVRAHLYGLRAVPRVICGGKTLSEAAKRRQAQAAHRTLNANVTKSMHNWFFY